MLSTRRLQSSLTAPHERVTVVPSRAISFRRGARGATLLLGGGAEVDTRVIVDCSGPRRVLSGGVPAGVRAEQTAYGITVPDQGGITQAFMDWRADHGQNGWPSFLYAVPMGESADGTPLVLLEETALARRPALPVPVLERRLHLRLRARGIETSAAHAEQVRFPVDTPPTAGVGPVVAFGAAAPTMHPATGYSLGASLMLVDAVVEALIAGLPDEVEAAAAVREVLWPRSALVVHHLRRRGLEAVLALDAAGVVDFFDVFFSLPTSAQRVYLSDRNDVGALMAVMWQIFRRADNPLRRHLWRWGLPPQGDHIARAVSPSG